MTICFHRDASIICSNMSNAEGWRSCLFNKEHAFRARSDPLVVQNKYIDVVLISGSHNPSAVFFCERRGGFGIGWRRGSHGINPCIDFQVLQNPPPRNGNVPRRRQWLLCHGYVPLDPGFCLGHYCILRHFHCR